MRLALAEAGRAALGGDVPVGAVVLGPDGTTVLGAGHNEREAAGDPTAHAEVL
ncbi:nucleoside deaminase, partial [Streptomyces sp. SID1328]|uniref:nucleoside deaminase n=1 Tax=Streptomyces sp. SID1328 TaxID=2690250 RepID=UPI00192773D0